MPEKGIRLKFIAYIIDTITSGRQPNQADGRFILRRKEEAKDVRATRTTYGRNRSATVYISKRRIL